MEINFNALVEYKKEETVYLSFILKTEIFWQRVRKNSMENYRLNLFNCFLLKAEIRNIVISTFLYLFFLNTHVNWVRRAFKV